MSVHLTELTHYLNEILEPTPCPDVAINGLQIPGNSLVRKIAVATDASLQTFEQAIALKCDFLFVHHGMFWTYNKESAISPLQKKKLKLLFDHGLSLYASHLPLDIHPELGNNISVFEALELSEPTPFGLWQGQLTGLIGSWSEGLDFQTLTENASRIFGPPRTWNFGPRKVNRAGLVTGQGQSSMQEAIRKGCDVFITGEMNHYMVPVAQENHLNLLLLGHYKSETLGVKRVGQRLEKKFNLPYVFLDFPTGL